MIYIEVKTACGNSWRTGFNGTLATARAYFMGQKFECARLPVTSVELV